MSATHVAVIPHTRTHSDKEEFHLTSSGYHSTKNESGSRRNKGETEEKSPDYIPSAQCQI